MAEEFTVEQQKVIAIARARRMREEAAAAAEANRAANEVAFQRREAWASAGPMERAKMMVGVFAPKAKEMITEAGAVGVGTAIGQAAGQKVAGKVGRTVGGAVGAAAAETGVELAEGNGIKPGRIYAAGLQGAMPTRGAGKTASVNAAAEVVRSLIDERQFPSLQGLSTAALAGYVAAKASQGITGKELTQYDALMEYRNEAFSKLRKEGFVVNPQELKRGGELMPRLAGGPAAIGVDAINKNQYPIQSLTRAELGLSKKPLPFRPDKRNPVTGAIEKKGEIGEVIERLEQPYKQVRNISETAQKELEAFQQGKAKTWRWAGKSPDEVDAILKANDNLDALKRARDEVKDAHAARKAGEEGAHERLKAAEALEDSLEAKIQLAATATGDSKLLQRLVENRKKLAQTFAVRDSLTSYGTVDIQELAAMRATPSRPGRFLTGNLADLADFAEAFGRNAQELASAPLPGGAGSALNYAGRQTLQGRAAGPISEGIPYLSSAARNMLMSDLMQNSMTKPQYIFRPENMPAASVRNFLMTAGRDAPQALNEARQTASGVQ